MDPINIEAMDLHALSVSLDTLAAFEQQEHGMPRTPRLRPSLCSTLVLPLHLEVPEHNDNAIESLSSSTACESIPGGTSSETTVYHAQEPSATLQRFMEDEINTSHARINGFAEPVKQPGFTTTNLAGLETSLKVLDILMTRDRSPITPTCINHDPANPTGHFGHVDCTLHFFEEGALADWSDHVLSKHLKQNPSWMMVCPFCPGDVLHAEEDSHNTDQGVTTQCLSHLYAHCL